MKTDEVPCNPHPCAPHGFNRNASHNAHRYVCDCEGWEPEQTAMTGVDVEALRVLLAKARYWQCTRDTLRCADGNGCECAATGDADPLPELQRLAIRALPALLAKSAAYDALVARIGALAAKWARHSADNFGDRANSLSCCADDIRLLVEYGGDA